MNFILKICTLFLLVVSVETATADPTEPCTTKLETVPAGATALKGVGDCSAKWTREGCEGGAFFAAVSSFSLVWEAKEILIFRDSCTGQVIKSMESVRYRDEVKNFEGSKVCWGYPEKHPDDLKAAMAACEAHRKAYTP